MAGIEGYALGGALEVADACGLRLAADTAVFGMPEVRLGIPSVVEAALLPMLIGYGRTRQLLLLGQNISAAEALNWGFVERLAAPDALDAAVAEGVAALLARGPNAIRLQKKLILDLEELPPAAALR